MKLKRLVLIILCAALLCLCGCGEAEPVPEEAEAPSEYTLKPVETAPVTPTPSPDPVPDPTPTPYEEYIMPVIEKSPWTEYTSEGHCIYFSVNADNVKYYNWYIYDADYNYITWSDALNQFEGLIAAGTTGDTLCLGNVCTEMNGCKVRCLFTGYGGAEIYSDFADIYVDERTVKLHGEKRSTVDGTGGADGYGAVVDYGDSIWWIVEEFPGEYSLWKRDTVKDFPIQETMLQIYSSGTIKLELGGRTYTGSMPEERIYGIGISAELACLETGDTCSINFDYTSYSEYYGDYAQLELNIWIEPGLLWTEDEKTEGAEGAAESTEDIMTVAAAEPEKYSVYVTRDDWW